MKEEAARPTCGKCGKRLGVVNFECKCGERFCARHRLPESHACKYDFKTQGKNGIKSQNPRIVAPKVVVL